MRTLQKASSFVLASLKPSTWEWLKGFFRSPRSIAWTNGSHEVRCVPPWAIARCGLAGRPFSASALSVAMLSAVIIMAGLAVVTAAQEEDMAMVSAALAPRAEGLIIARCSVCHSPDLVAQQRLPRARWEATVEKMKHWGAEVSNDEADLLVRYFSARYHPGAPDHLPPLDSELRKAEPFTQDSVTEGPITGVATRGAGIFEHNCQGCHGTGATGGMGPKLAKNPILKHEDLFWETVLHGRGPMPAWGSVLSHQDIADVHAWLLSK